MLDMLQPRDAFLASLCRYALPPPLAAKQDKPDAISFAPVDSAYEPLPFTTLSAKNVQTLKSLFNIAHCLGGLLGPSWNLVLQTLEQLDRIIASSKLSGTASEVAIATSNQRGVDATSHELSVLSTALHNLFSGSSRLSNEAIQHFLTALSTQCFALLAHEATSKERLVPRALASSAPLRLFALTYFVDVALHNMHRILLLWPVVTQLLLPAANHKSPRIRIVGIEALVKVVIAAMRHHMHLKREPQPHDGEGSPAAAHAAVPVAVHAITQMGDARAPSASQRSRVRPMARAAVIPQYTVHHKRLCVHSTLTTPVSSPIIGSKSRVKQANIAPFDPPVLYGVSSRKSPTEYCSVTRTAQSHSRDSHTKGSVPPRTPPALPLLIPLAQ